MTDKNQQAMVEAALRGAFADQFGKISTMSSKNDRENNLKRVSDNLDTSDGNPAKAPRSNYSVRGEKGERPINVSLKDADSALVQRIGTEVMSEVLNQDGSINKGKADGIATQSDIQIKALDAANKAAVVSTETLPPEGSQAGLPKCPPGLKLPSVCR